MSLIPVSGSTGYGVPSRGDAGRSPLHLAVANRPAFSIPQRGTSRCPAVSTKRSLHGWPGRPGPGRRR